MEVNKLSKLLEHIDEVLDEDPKKDGLKAALVNYVINTDKSGMMNKLLGSGILSGDSLLSKNWRPLLVVLVAGILINNYVIYPYLHLFVDGAPYFQLDSNIINGIMAFLVTYTGGRSAEKIFQIKNNGQQQAPPPPVED